MEFDLSPGFVRTNPLNWSLDNNGSVVIAAASGDRIALFDLDGNFLPGWPTIDGDGWWVTAGPRLGDVTGDGELNVVVMMRSYWADAAQLRVYDLDGNRRQEFEYEHSGFPIATTGAVILYDLDSDSVNNVIFALDSIYAVDENGTVLPGYPRSLEGYVAGYLGLVVVPDEFEPGPVLISTSSDAIDVESLDSGTSLQSWPVQFPTSYGVHAMPIVLPYQDRWAISIFSADSLFLWDWSGNIVAGFPRRLEEGGLCRALSATDVDQDGTPEIAAQRPSTEAWLVDLQGQTIPGFPWNDDRFFKCRGEDIVSLHIEGEDSARLFLPADLRVDDTYQYQHGIMSLYGSSASPGYPVYTNRIENGYSATSAIIWTEQSDTLHILHLASYGYLTVFDLPLPGASVKLIWPVPGGNSAGNKVFTPGHYVGIDEEFPEHSSSLPISPKLQNLYPNPSNGGVYIDAILPNRFSGTVSICDVLGRLVWSESIGGSGQHFLYWNANNLHGLPVPSGRYFLYFSETANAATTITIVR